MIVVGSVVATMSNLGLVPEAYNLKNLITLTWPNIFGAQ